MSEPSETDLLANYSSELTAAPQRFLSRIMQHTLANAWQTPDDFLEHFGPRAIMTALSGANEVRARLLVKLANVHDRIAAKKSIESASEDLTLVLEEKVTSPEAVLECFTADERVKYLKADELWTFLFDDAFYKTTPQDSAAAHDRAVRRMTFILDCALSEDLLTLEKIGDGIGFARIADCLPPEELRKVVTRALEGGRRDQALTEERLLDVVPLQKLVGFVPLAVIWNEVVLARLAAAAKFVDGVQPVPESDAGKAASEKSTSEKKEDDSRTNRRPPAKPRPTSTVALPAAGVGIGAAAAGVAAGPAAGAAAEAPPSSGGAADEARNNAIARLEEIDRLPLRLDDLSTPVLLSIESMYEDLLEANSDEERAECIRESFPNESHLRVAMLALAEVLEPSIDVTRPPISDADTEALVKLVVFEERKRKEGDGGARRGSVRPPPLPVGRPASSVPAARVTVPPPLPGMPGNNKSGRND